MRPNEFNQDILIITSANPQKNGKNSCSTLYKIIEPSKSLSFVHSEMTFGCSIKSNNGTSALIRIV